MLDIKFVRENPELVKENIRKKFQDFKLPMVDEVLERYDMDGLELDFMRFGRVFAAGAEVGWDAASKKAVAAGAAGSAKFGHAVADADAAALTALVRLQQGLA